MTTNYDKTYPNPLDPPRNDVQTMQNNALAIYNIWDKDHYTFDGAFPGFHKKSTYIADSAPPSALNQIVEYGKISSGSTELFIRRDGVATEIQLTRGNVSATGSFNGNPATGYTFLPGGILLQWGSITASTSGTAITYPVAFTTLFSIVGNIQAGGPQAFTIKSVSTSGAVAQSSSGPQAINWMAVGV